MRTPAIFVGWLTLASVAHAQSDWAAVQQLATGHSQVRIEAGGRRAAGTISRVTDSEIVIRNAYGDVAHFDRQQVSRVEQVIGGSSAKKRGVVIGFLAGAGVSAIAAWSSGERGDRRKHELPLIYGVTMGGGALLGGLLADAERTQLIYTR